MDSFKFGGGGMGDLNTEKASVLNFNFTTQKPQKGPRHSEDTYFQLG